MLLLLAPLPLVVLANLGQSRAWAAIATYVAIACVAAAVALLGALDFGAALLFAVSPAASGSQPSAAFGAGLFLTGVLACSLVVPGVRSLVARVLPIDASSPVHALALALSLLVLGFNVSLQLSSDVLQQTAQSDTSLTPADLVAQEVPFVFAALLGVGLFVRRTFAESLARLSLVRPAWWRVALALAAAGLFYAFGTGIDFLSQTFTPDLAHKVDAANQRLFGKLDNPLGIVTLAVAAGVCEEMLFRGALQPRFGIVLTSVLFASVHTQYGLSFDVAGVLVLSIGLGLLARYANTTTATVCHVAYDLLVGVGITLSLLPWAALAEAALIALLVFAYLRISRSSRPLPLNR